MIITFYYLETGFVCKEQLIDTDQLHERQVYKLFKFIYYLHAFDKCKTAYCTLAFICVFHMWSDRAILIVKCKILFSKLPCIYTILKHFGQISLEYSINSNQPTWISCWIYRHYYILLWLYLCDTVCLLRHI